MQQPPSGRPPNQPYRPPAAGPPRAAAPPPGYAPAAPAPPPYAPGPAGSPPFREQAMGLPVAPVAPRRKGRGFLRFFAGSCVGTAWLTLVVSLLLGVGSMLLGASAWGGGASRASTNYFPTPSPAAGELGGQPGLGTDGAGGLGGMGAGGAGGVGGMQDALGALNLPGILGALAFWSGVLTALTGIVFFVFFLGVGRLTYAYLELEEQSFQANQTIQLLLARLGGAR